METFILVLLTLIHKKRLLNPNSKHTFLYDVQLPEVNKVILMYISAFSKGETRLSLQLQKSFYQRKITKLGTRSGILFLFPHI